MNEFGKYDERKQKAIWVMKTTKLKKLDYINKGGIEYEICR